MALLSYGVTKRQREPLGCVAAGFIWLVLSVSSSLGLMASLSMLDSLSVYVTGERYSAEIVDYNSYVEDDDDGDDELMFTPIVAFAHQGLQIEKALDISSSAPPELRTTITVYYDYQRDAITELTLGGTLFMLVGLAFGLVLMSPALAAAQYSLGTPVAVIKGWSGALVFKFVVPVALVLFWGLLCFVLLQYFSTDEKDHLPVWVVVVLGFFALSMGFAVVGYLKMIFGRDEHE